MQARQQPVKVAPGAAPRGPRGAAKPCPECRHHRLAAPGDWQSIHEMVCQKVTCPPQSEALRAISP